MFRSATFKLTMWYLALVMVISISFSVVLYRVTTNELSRGLRHEIVRIDKQFPIFNDNELLQPQAEYQYGQHRIWLRLVGFNLIVLAGAGLASYWLARRTLEPIEAAHEQQKRFTSDVSHELRTPLTALRMESEVALFNKKGSASELRKTLESNLEEVGKLENLVNNLLRLTRLEAEELQQNFTMLSLAAVSSEALERVAKVAKSQKIQLVNEAKDTEFYGDYDSLVQLLVILLDNAIKYSPMHSIVSLSGGAKSDSVTIKVIDKGSGIAPEALEHVFDRFYRADTARTRTDGGEEGYGLGLSIAKMIADFHKGDIRLTSRVNHGTTATVILPRS
ncbi:MAG TPA: HAMP domain-containing sensor histidine kinase [Candidatus Saccharimonadales bacterium]|nr:HAMP domain-containing sensor histidine kinase [Candidatus Saccharimonadales bacterium]